MVVGLIRGASFDKPVFHPKLRMLFVYYLEMNHSESFKYIGFKYIAFSFMR